MGIIWEVLHPQRSLFTSSISIFAIMNITAVDSDNGGPISNFNNVKNDGQFFVVSDIPILYETPSTPLFEGKSMSWCSDVHIKNITSLDNTTVSRGYTARCVLKRIVDQSALEEAGASLPDGILARRPFTSPMG